jgi:hypothetical protein
MNKKQAFRFSTFIMLASLFFLMPAFINKVPVFNFGPITLILNKIFTNNDWFKNNQIEIFQYINISFLWLSILLITRFLKQIVGWRAALFGVLLLPLCPRFLGASVQNVVDIPFTFFYLFSITQIYSFCREIPRIKVKRLIFLTISSLFAAFIHPAALVLVIYLFVFITIALIFRFNVKWLKASDKKMTITKIAIYTILLIVAVFIVSGISASHFYHIHLKSPFEALKLLNYGDSGHREIFESKLHNTNSLPYYYLVKYLFITTPIVILIGIFFLFAFINKMKKDLNPHILFVLLGSLLFPIIFSLFVKMNHHGYWSIYYISVPLLVVMAIIGTESLLRRIDDRYVNTVISIVLFLLILPPMRHVAISAPATSVYFNEFAGGISSSYGKYTLDLNDQYPQIASKWLITHIYAYDVRDFKDNDTILVLTDANIDCTSYFNDTKYMKVKNGTYEQFSNGLGEYFMSFGNNLDPNDFKSGKWPPESSVYTIKVEDAPMVAFLKRDRSLK